MLKKYFSFSITLAYIGVLICDKKKAGTIFQKSKTPFTFEPIQNGRSH